MRVVRCDNLLHSLMEPEEPEAMVESSLLKHTALERERERERNMIFSQFSPHLTSPR